jgi:hypothetical protein
MFKKTKLLLPLMFALAGASVAQSAEPAKFYKLDFVVKELDGGKPVNSRTFSTMLGVQTPGRDASPAVIRAGGRVPVTVGSGVNFVELGVNIDVRDLRDSQGDLSVFVSADISTMMQETPGNQPVVRQNKWSGAVLITPKKPTVVFASDDLSSKRQLQLELTATPIK